MLNTSAKHYVPFCVALLFSGIPHLSSEDTFSEVKLVAPDAAADEKFGISVDLNGTTLAVGMDPSASSAGAVHVFRRSHSDIAEWTHLRKLTAAEGNLGDRIGSSVATAGSVVVAGALGDDHAGAMSGSAYIFQDTSPTGDWSTYRETKLTASDAGEFDWFGFAVEINDTGSTVFVSAQQRNKVYVFKDTSSVGDWSSYTENKIVFPAGLSVGSSLSNFDATLVTADAGNFYPYAYILQDTSPSGDWGSYSEIEFTPTDWEANDWFGPGVGISGTTIVVAAQIAESSVGAVYIYQDTSESSDWSTVTEKRILPSDKPTSTQFAWNSLAIDRGTIVAGARGDNELGESAGAAYVFEDTSSEANWTTYIETKITPSDAVPTLRFGGAVAVNGPVIVVGSERDGHAGTNSGAVYVFFRPLIFSDGFETGDTSAW